MSRYDYKRNIDEVEREGLNILIKWFEGIGCKVVDLTGSKDDFAHKGDIRIDGKKTSYAQVKIRRRKYLEFHRKDNLVWVTVEDPRVERKGLAGTSIYNDKSDVFLTCYIENDSVAKLICFFTQEFKKWLKNNENSYKLKTCSIRGSDSTGRLVDVDDVPDKLKWIYEGKT